MPICIHCHQEKANYEMVTDESGDISDICELCARDFDVERGRAAHQALLASRIHDTHTSLSEVSTSAPALRRRPHRIIRRVRSVLSRGSRAAPGAPSQPPPLCPLCRSPVGLDFTLVDWLGGAKVPWHAKCRKQWLDRVR